MSCGLGAIILVFMLVKHNVEKSMLETELLEQDLTRLAERDAELEASKSSIIARLADVDSDIQQANDNLNSAQTSAKSAQTVVAAINEAKKTLEEGIKSLEVPKPTDIVKKQRVGEEQYLIGLTVEGPKIAILIDSSASMTDETLIDVIRRKNGNVRNKRNGPKWRRTLAVAEWLINRVPQNSQVALISFSDKAVSHTNSTYVSGRNTQGLMSSLSRLRSVTPTGATNLEAALGLLGKLNPTNIYVVTDGLPTRGTSSYKSLNPFSDCSALWGGAAKISGACRKRLFQHTVRSAPTVGATVNVVLLPIEGDPEAAQEYWNWAAAHSGTLISPAASWP